MLFICLLMKDHMMLSAILLFVNTAELIYMVVGKMFGDNLVNWR